MHLNKDVNKLLKYEKRSINVKQHGRKKKIEFFLSIFLHNIVLHNTRIKTLDYVKDTNKYVINKS